VYALTLINGAITPAAGDASAVVAPRDNRRRAMRQVLSLNTLVTRALLRSVTIQKK